MAQARQSAQATGEVLRAGTIQEEVFSQFLQSYRIPPGIASAAPPLMLVESLPRHIIEREARQDLLHFAPFDATFDFTPYTAGRIFHALGELRWERRQSAIQIVYTGSGEYTPDLPDSKEIALDAFWYTERDYLLFGKKLDEAQRERIGPLAQPGDFAEVRLPRLLRYPALPTLAGAERVQLVVREYEEFATALNVAYRFKSLVRFQKQEEITGERYA